MRRGACAESVNFSSRTLQLHLGPDLSWDAAGWIEIGNSGERTLKGQADEEPLSVEVIELSRGGAAPAQSDSSGESGGLAEVEIALATLFSGRVGRELPCLAGEGCKNQLRGKSWIQSSSWHFWEGSSWLLVFRMFKLQGMSMERK